MTIRLLSMLCCLTALIVRCGVAPTAGVETTNGASAVALLADGTPASFAKVKVLAYRDWSDRTVGGLPVVLDSTECDSSGRFVFARQWPSLVGMQLETATHGRFIRRLRTNSGGAADTFILDPLCTLSGQSPPGATRPVMLAGTSYQAAVDPATGVFQFDRVPLGRYAILVNALDVIASPGLFLGGFAGLSAGMVSNMGVIRPVDTLPLSSVDQDSFSFALAPITRGGDWRRISDEAIGGRSSASIALENDGAGYVVRINAVLRNSSIVHPFAGLEGFFANEDDSLLRFFDLSALRSTSFRAKGPGRLRLTFHSYFIEASSIGWDQVGRTVTLDSTWQEFTIPFDSLRSEGQYSWAQICDSINGLGFTAVHDSSRSFPESTSIWIDAVRLNGLRVDQFLKQ